MERARALEQINRLIDENCRQCPKFGSRKQFKCDGCSIQKQLIELSEPLNKKSEAKIQKILAKGKDMTKSDLEYLLNKEVPQAEIRKAMKIRYEQFENLLKAWGFKEEVKKVPSKITKERYLELEGKGYSIEEIAKIAGVSKNYIYNKRYEWGLTKDEKKEPSITKEMYAKLEKDLDEQYKIVEEQKRQLNKIGSDNHELRYKLDAANADIVKLQKEIFKLKKELSEYKKLSKRYKEILAIESELNA